MTLSTSTPSENPQLRRRKSAREINAIMRKMVELKIAQRGTNKEDGSTIYAPTPKFTNFMAKAKERYLARSDKSQQLIMSLVNHSEEGSLVRVTISYNS